MALFRDAALPSHGSRRARFPTFVGTMTALRLPARASLVAYVFASRVHLLLHHSCPPWRSRGSGGLPRAWASCSAGVPFPACLHMDACGISQVSWRSLPHLCPVLQTPAEPIRPRLYRPHRCCPRSQHAEGFSAIMISGLTQGFSTCCLRFTSSVATARARLASGWRAAPLPGGSRTLRIATKGFRSQSLSGFILAQGKFHCEPPSRFVTQSPRRRATAASAGRRCRAPLPFAG